MDENIKQFLEKFAELERRVRKLAVEDRALREEVQSLREKLSAAEAEAEMFREMLAREQSVRMKARTELDDLIARLDGLKDGEKAPADGRLLAEVSEVEP